MIITNQISVIGIPIKRGKNESKHNTKYSHQITVQILQFRGTEERHLQNKFKTINKTAMSISIDNYQTINGLKVPTTNHRLAERIQKQDMYVC